MEQFKFDSTDLKGMIELMDKYGGSTEMFFGKNTEGEDMHISIFPDKIVTVTFQLNGWTRKNFYYREGWREETFEDRWK